MTPQLTNLSSKIKNLQFPSVQCLSSAESTKCTGDGVWQGWYRDERDSLEYFFNKDRGKPGFAFVELLFPHCVKVQKLI